MFYISSMLYTVFESIFIVLCKFKNVKYTKKRLNTKKYIGKILL